MEQILLFYKYVEIQWPEAIAKWQRKLCADLGLKGRVLLATEGINGTVAGTVTAIEEYTKALSEHPYFGDIDFKTSAGDRSAFPKMRILIKKEIVNLGIDPEKLKAKDGGIHLSPTQAHELMTRAPKDLVIIDIRNNYETRIGTFRNAITPNVSTTREFPEYIDKNIDMFKDKQVLMTCTGGVRCERVTAYLKEKNVATEVYQIYGGIHRYAEQYPDGHFRGINYVFDARGAQRVNDDVLTTCDLCPTPSDQYNNCMNASCNNHYIACQNCLEKYELTCSQACLDLLKAGLVKPRPSVAYTTIKTGAATDKTTTDVHHSV